MTEKCHFIGIGGIGMSGLAQILLEKNKVVSGSDLSKNEITINLENKGAKIYSSHLEQNICQGMKVIYNSSISQTNPEYLAAIKLKCPILHRSDLLVELTRGYKTLAVTGTHGKTTTSALLTTVMKAGGKDPTYSIGGIITQYNTNAEKGLGQYFIAEADESDGTFVKYDPYGAIVTNIGFDHISHFGGKNQLLEAFSRFVKSVKGPLLWCGDDEHLKRVVEGGISYGFSSQVDLRAENYRQKGWTLFIDIHFQGRVYSNVELPLIGKHNALNALGVFGLALNIGIDEMCIRKAFLNFKGVKRRSEKKWEEKSVLFLDDYAHHPTEIQSTLSAIGEAIEKRRLIVVYEPHRYSRVQECLGQFKEIFNTADLLIVTDIYSAGEEPIPQITHDLILKEVKGIYVPRNELSDHLHKIMRPLDVIVSLGAGGITNLSKECLPKKISKLKVGIVSGGGNIEHEISLLSAKNIRKEINKELYEVTEIIFDKGDHWQEKLKLLCRCEIIFPVVHGIGCEDGVLQGFLEKLDIPYVGCDFQSCMICMDKAITKHLMLRHGIATLPFIDFSSDNWKKEKELILRQIERELRYPLFVKGVHGGSSVGISKVLHPENLKTAIDLAFHYDDHLIVENAITARELEFAVLGSDEITVFPPGEVLTHSRVYDYEAKYGQNCFKATPYPELTELQRKEGMELAKKAYKICRCFGLTRVDFFLDEKGGYWLSELNPMPGFTNNSLFPQICNANGLSTEKLIDKLITLGLYRKRKQQMISKCL